eukprot:SAG31_NODE_2953_length_4866_cov_7.809104_4_plen_86_part_00
MLAPLRQLLLTPLVLLTLSPAAEVSASPDCAEPTNGPNGAGCVHGVCRDAVSGDGAFACRCHPPWSGKGCCFLVFVQLFEKYGKF